MVTSLNPSQLTGPRSYFTDLDPKDLQTDTTLIQQKLKLQLLTKKTIVIAASSMFHREGFNFFKSDDGLMQAMQKGIFSPAIRDEFSSIDGFFDAKKSDEFVAETSKFFSENTSSFVKWNLKENTTWFHQTIVKVITDPLTPVRMTKGLTEDERIRLVNNMDSCLLSKQSNQQFLSRDDVLDAAGFLSFSNQLYVRDLTNFLYRLSGARVVNCTGHFPQPNLTSVKLSGNEHLLTEDRIFWELYIEAVSSYYQSAARFSSERLNQLSFSDVLKIREDLFDVDFSETYDKLLFLSKSEISLIDPDKLLMTQDEIFRIASSLEKILKTRLSGETRHKKDNSKKLMQLTAVRSKPQQNQLLSVGWW